MKNFVQISAIWGLFVEIEFLENSGDSSTKKKGRPKLGNVRTSRILSLVIFQL